GAAGDDNDLQARGGIPGRPESTEHHTLELALAPAREERRALHRADARLDPDRRQVAGDRLAYGVVWRRDGEVPAVKAARMAGLGQQPPRLRRVVRIGLD